MIYDFFKLAPTASPFISFLIDLLPFKIFLNMLGVCTVVAYSFRLAMVRFYCCRIANNSLPLERETGTTNSAEKGKCIL